MKKTIHLSGGLGNQMFQYAYGRLMWNVTGEHIEYNVCEIQHGSDENIDILNFVNKAELFVSNRMYAITKPLLNRSGLLRRLMKVYKEEESFVVNERAFFNDAEYYIGYWQNIKYLEPIKDLLARELVYNRELSEKENEWVERIRNENSVAVHVRRGDYLQKQDRYVVLSSEYYTDALEVIKVDMKRRGIKPLIYVFSDDITWCKSNLYLGDDVVYIDKTISLTDSFDFYLMQSAPNIVMGNSTFSWWATWLSDSEKRIVITPSTWYTNSVYNSKAINAIITPKWICI